jgi:hypothetical protein
MISLGGDREDLSARHVRYDPSNRRREDCRPVRDDCRSRAEREGGDHTFGIYDRDTPRVHCGYLGPTHEGNRRPDIGTARIGPGAAWIALKIWQSRNRLRERVSRKHGLLVSLPRVDEYILGHRYGRAAQVEPEGVSRRRHRGGERGARAIVAAIATVRN